MVNKCRTCGQPLPEVRAKDPPLPPLDHPAVVTIHDLPPEKLAKIKIAPGGLHKAQTWSEET